MKYNQFHSQYGEDQFLVENNLVPETGFFIDVGADQPSLGSNTYYFECNGWNGICIDADPRVINKLEHERTSKIINCAVSDQIGTITFELNHLAGISAISNIQKPNTISIPCTTLNKIIEENNIKQIDLLDIDVEGHEIEVCNGLDWNKYKPKIIIIEYISPIRGNIIGKIKDYFNNLPYQLKTQTSSNLIYILNV